MAIYQLDQHIPDIHPTAYIADSAALIGKVRLGERVSIWFGATLRGDNELIDVGDDSNIQEGTVLHTRCPSAKASRSDIRPCCTAARLAMAA